MMPLRTGVSPLESTLPAQLDELLQEHSAVAEQLFSYLQSQSERGFTAQQFLVFRDNYFYRTATTIESVAKVALAAVHHADFDSAAGFAENLYQETGEGTPWRSHRLLLECCFNLHADQVFSLDWLDVAAASTSPHILPEARAYRSAQAALYGGEYVVALAASFAQEKAASGMLAAIHRSLFVPHRDRYPRGLFEFVEQYFTIHLGGMEDRHGELARQALLRNCTTEHLRRLALDGATRFLDAQARLWIALSAAMKAAALSGHVRSGPAQSPRS